MALDSIHILLTRPYSNESHYQMTIDRVFDNMDLLDSVYESLLFDPTDDIDETKYPIIKKFVDMIVVSMFVSQRLRRQMAKFKNILSLY